MAFGDNANDTYTETETISYEPNGDRPRKRPILQAFGRVCPHIPGEGKTEGVFSLALDANGVVTIGGETIPVKPTIGELDGEGAVATQPFAVGKGAVTVTVKAIPGLRYELRRRETLSAPVGEGADGTGWDEVGEPVVATGTRVALTDANPPKGGAFYRIVVKIEEF